MKILISIICFVSLFVASCNQDVKKTEVTPVPSAVEVPKAITTIQWVDSVKVIGKVSEGEKVEITYRFINIGDNPLVIENVVPTCGCTVAEKPQEPIAPGKEGLIKASFDSQGRTGANHKSITVYANTKEMIHPLVFEVEVIPNNK
jgi:hypothetical protein